MAVKESAKAMEIVGGLTAAAGRVGEIVSLINEIAEKTNLLALNATIEAARAGEAGRGFAVVAGEVKELAGQTAKATAEIAAQIDGIQAATNRSASAIRSVNETIEKMNAISATISAAVEQQEAATGEISRNVTEASTGTTFVTRSVGDITVASGEAAEVSRHVLSSTRSLSGQSRTLDTELTRFLDSMNAA